MEKKNILLVEDEEDLMRLLSLRLESMGFNVITASSGEEALDKIKLERPAAVLLDIFMPGMGGMEVLKTLRQTDDKLPVFFMTALPKNEIPALERKKLNISGFIEKTGDLNIELENMARILSTNT